MRYLKTESTYILGNFTTGDTVTITIYRLSDDTKVVDAATCSEIGTTGRFKYLFSQSVTTKTEYLWIMTNGIEEQQGKIILGGYPDDIKAQTDKMDFVGTDIKATLDGEKVVLTDETEAQIDAIEADTDEIQSKLPNDEIAGSIDKTSLESKHGSGSWEGTTPADVADAVWDEKLNEHQKANTTGYELKHITGGIVPRQPLTVRDKEKILEYLETLLKKLNAVITKLSDEQIKKLANDLAQRLVSDIEKQNEIRDKILLSLADINTLEELFNYERRANSSGISKKETRTSRNHNSKA